MSDARGELPTERPNPASRDFDLLSAEEAVAVMQAADREIHAALAREQGAIARAIELVAERLARGGRLFYVGAGTSGRLALLDAVECPPTFHSDPKSVQAIVAGGAAALVGAVEAAEDDERAAGVELAARGLSAADCVLGIAAGGTTPFVHGALRFARERQAACIFLACVPREQVGDDADVSIRVVTGPEVIAGSTRLKAGTVTKLVLNTISTAVFARLGKVHGNLMVDVATGANQKLLERGRRLVAELAGVDPERAAALLTAADGEVKTAVVMAARRLAAPAARAALAEVGGSLRRALPAGR
jgi:N-acetylmuramic acid 6-phosphate etherase